MNEFIVWDKDNYFGEDTHFHELDRFLEDGLSVHFEKDNGLVIIEYDVDDYQYPKPLEIETFQYIGKKDIEGNKIYADCNIVEFEIYGDIYKGYFKYSKKHLAYVFNFIGKRISYTINPTFNQDWSNFKIIDTIQQNKLGLIK